MAGTPPQLSATATAKTPSQDGTFTLQWHGDEADTFHVQLALGDAGDAFVDWYTGAAQQSFVSGMPSGIVRARVRGRRGPDAPWSEWSPALEIPVQHHSMAKALVLFTVGLVVFVVIAAFIVVASRRTAEGGARD